MDRNNNTAPLDEDDDGSDTDAAVCAYLINKPAGWSIFTPKLKKKKRNKSAPSIKELVNDVPEVNLGDNADLTSLLTPEEMQEMGIDDLSSLMSFSEKDAAIARAIEQSDDYLTEDELLQIAQTVAEAPAAASMPVHASDHNASPKPAASRTNTALVAWLKQYIYNETDGSWILPAGPKNWKAVAGAVDVDDSGVVLLVPKDSVSDVLVEEARFLCVVGNGENMSSGRGKEKEKAAAADDSALPRIQAVRKFNRARREDILILASASLYDDPNPACSDIVPHIQEKFKDGIRGDSTASPLDRRAQRRLIHCESLRVSSLVQDDWMEAEADVPDDIAVLTEESLSFQESGSFRGRSNFQFGPEVTNAYREINSAADGFPGWTVDRYDKWLFIKRDEGAPMGPLPSDISMQDGSTEGVYIYDGLRDRSMSGPLPKPELYAGSPAPESLVVLENGVKYHVNLGEQFSTGLFLDQRLQRTWLRNNCDENTRVLNCFAHCGGFSIAAAVAGASTVSLDLDKKWLDRIEGQFVENGVDFDDRHDCIYGDCKFNFFTHTGYNF